MSRNLLLSRARLPTQLRQLGTTALPPRDLRKLQPSLSRRKKAKMDYPVCTLCGQGGRSEPASVPQLNPSTTRIITLSRRAPPVLTHVFIIFRVVKGAKASAAVDLQSEPRTFLGCNGRSLPSTSKDQWLLPSPFSFLEAVHSD
jgi:hypothetical protein